MINISKLFEKKISKKFTKFNQRNIYDFVSVQGFLRNNETLFIIEVDFVQFYM